MWCWNGLRRPKYRNLSRLPRTPGSRLDIDPKRAASLREGILPIYEPHVDDLFQLYRKNLTFGSDLALAMRDADAIFVTVGTPSLPDGRPDLQYIDSAAEMIGAHLTDRPTLIINKSTIPVGTNRRVE